MTRYVTLLSGIWVHMRMSGSRARDGVSYRLEGQHLHRAAAAVGEPEATVDGRTVAAGGSPLTAVGWRPRHCSALDASPIPPAAAAAAARRRTCDVSWCDPPARMAYISLTHFADDTKELAKRWTLASHVRQAAALVQARARVPSHDYIIITFLQRQGGYPPARRSGLQQPRRHICAAQGRARCGGGARQAGGHRRTVVAVNVDRL